MPVNSVSEDAGTGASLGWWPDSLTEKVPGSMRKLSQKIWLLVTEEDTHDEGLILVSTCMSTHTYVHILVYAAQYS